MKAIAVAALAFAAAGCNASVSSSERAPLGGRSFVATSARGFDLPVGSALRLTFDGLRLQMTGGCTTRTADYDVVDGLLVLQQQMSSTEMACERPLLDLDTEVLGLLASGPTVKLQGDALTLADGARTLKLADRPVQSDRPLEGTLWAVHTVITGDTTTGGFGGAVATVLFRNGMAEVNGGCNTGSASATVRDATIELGPVGLTKFACVQSTMELEFMVAVVLQGPVAYRIAGDELTLINGDNGLVLTAAADA